MSSLFDEIKEEMTREKYTQLWKRYGSYVILASVLTVLATAGGVVWKSKQQKNNEQQGNQLFYALQNTEKTPELLEELIKSGNSSYASLASLHKAAMLHQQGKTDEAIAVYESTGKNNKAPEEVRDMAIISALKLKFNRGDISEEDKKSLERISQKKNPWHWSATELRGLMALDKKDFTEAEELFTLISKDNTAPKTMQQRAAALLTIVAREKTRS